MSASRPAGLRGGFISIVDPAPLNAPARLQGLLLDELRAGVAIGVFTCSPPDLSQGGLPLKAAAGLELGLIANFDLPWNIRSARRGLGALTSSSVPET
jgi:hypothetical protein